MARPTRSATRLRTIRTRNSPRCSMNDILSGRIGVIVLPALDEVPEGADAVAGREPFADGSRHERLALDDRIAQRAAPGEAGGDRRRVRASGAVRIGRVELGSGKAREVAPVHEDVRRRVGEVASVHSYRERYDHEW